jgi:hypothetical protein
LIVFIDEINAKLNNQHVYDAFLEPLEDGTYVHSGKTFRLAPCVWIFAGTEEPTRAKSGAPASDKAEDFQSRLTRPVHLQFLTPAKLRSYALRFPRTVSETIKDLLVETAYPSQNPDERRPRAGR